jgi:uncharacterized membrane protein
MAKWKVTHNSRDLTSPGPGPVYCGMHQLSTKTRYLCLALLTVAAALLRISYLTAQGLNLDEGFSAYLGRTTLPDFAATVWNSEFNMVLYYALLRLWMHLGHSEFVIRLLSVAFATATVPVAYFLARRLFPDGCTALIAAFLLTVHPFHLVLSQDARSYSLLVLLVTLASLFFVRALQFPTWTNATTYALFSAAAVYSHFFALLVIFSHGVALLFYPGKVPANRIALTVFFFMLFLLPFGLFMAHHGNVGHVSWVEPLHRQQMVYLLYSLTLSKFRSLTYIIAWFAALAASVSSARENAWPYRFAASWLFVPPLITLFVSVWRPLLVERFLSVCIPGSVLLAAAGLTIIARRSRAVALAVLLAMVFYSASNIRHYFRHPEYAENWREASAYLLSRVQPEDKVVLLPGLCPLTFDYYRQRNPRRVADIRFADSAATPLPTPPPRTVWFIGSVLLTPSWADEAETFAQAHRGEYCGEPPQPESGSVRVWEFKRCGPD